MRGILLFVMLQQAVPGVGKGGKMLLRDLGLIAGLGLTLTLILIIWAVGYVQKGKRRTKRRHHHRHGTRAEVSGHSDEESEGEEGREHRRHHGRRRRRRDHRGRNPSLAETGGLPPTREDEPEAEAKE